MFSIQERLKIWTFWSFTIIATNFLHCRLTRLSNGPCGGGSFPHGVGLPGVSGGVQPWEWDQVPLGLQPHPGLAPRGAGGSAGPLCDQRDPVRAHICSRTQVWLRIQFYLSASGKSLSLSLTPEGLSELTVCPQSSTTDANLDCEFVENTFPPWSWFWKVENIFEIVTRPAGSQEGIWDRSLFRQQPHRSAEGGLRFPRYSSR